ncbi:MAG: hypothetical protein GY707_12700 [Desulfobacteraceae bacterium]|nr:hypothetical protein [Desulfobacteraceae bacterium]
MIQIIKDSFSFFLSNFNSIFKIYLPTTIVHLGGSVILDLLPNNGLSEFLQFIVGLTISSIYFSALIFLFYDRLNGNQISLKEYFLKSLIVVPLVLFTDCLGLLLILVGLLFLIIPGLFLAARLSLSSFFLLLSKDMPIDSIKNSYKFTKGHTKEILGCFGIIYIPYFIVFKIVPIGLEAKYGFAFSQFPSGIISDIFSTFLLIMLFRFYCLIQQESIEV